MKLTVNVTNNIDVQYKYVKDIEQRAIKKKGRLKPAQVSYLANAMTIAFHKYINNLSYWTETSHKFIATRNLISNAGSRVVKLGETNSNNGSEYNFGLHMVDYGYILGGDSVRFIMSKAVEKRLVAWIKAKINLGHIFYVNKQTKYSTKRIEAKKEYEFKKVAGAIMASGRNINTVREWYIHAMGFGENWETGNPYMDTIFKRLVSTGNLIPAITKEVADEITKLSKDGK